MDEPNFWETFPGPTNPNPVDGELSFTLFGYAPSLAFAIVGLVSFILLSIPQAWYVIKQRGTHRTFHILMLTGTLCESAGYAARIHATYNMFQVGNFSAQFLLLILAPILFTAAIDMTLNVMVRDFPNTDCLLLLRPRTVLIVFVTSDVVCIFVQLAGGALFGVSAGKEPGEGGISVDTATNVLMAGLILQILAWVIFIAFLLLAVFRAYQYKKYPHLKHHTYDPMRWLLLTLTAVTLLIFWRACFRTAESAAGYIGGPLSREDLFSTNDYLPVVLACILFTIAPPFRFTERAVAKGLHESHEPYGQPTMPTTETTQSEKPASPSRV